MFKTRYGQFDSTGRRYVIDDYRTPTPWTNVVCNGRAGFVVSQAGAGFSWLDNSQLCVLTRWDMDHVRDDRGRFLLVSDLDEPAARRSVWSLAPQPCLPAYDRYRCAHEPGRTTFSTSCHGIDAEWQLGVDPTANVESWVVTLHNRSDRPRRLRVASYLEWCCGVAPDVKREFHRLFFTVSKADELNAVIATKNMWEARFGTPDDHWNRPWPYAAGHRLVIGPGVNATRFLIGDKIKFVGRLTPPSRPEAMVTDALPDGGFGRFNDATAVAGADITIPANGSVTLGYVTAVADTQVELRSLLGEWSTVERCQQSIDGSVAMWADHLGRSTVATERPDFDLLNNTWLRYQAISGRLWGRTGYYQQSGAFGFRDQLQDSHVWLPIDPDRTRQQIMLHARHQFTNGEVYHWWHPLTEQGHRTACSDDYLWLPLLTVNYIKETGDFSILDAEAPFVDAPSMTAPLLDHCQRAINRSLSRIGPDGLPLIGDMDWNDGLSAIGDEKHGTSVWMAFFLRMVLTEFAEIFRRLERPDAVRRCLDQAQAMADAANKIAWDGSWYKRAFKRDNTWLGSAQSLEGKIFLNAQTWAILSDSAPPDRLASAWASAKEHLLTPYGPLLLVPAYTKPDPSVGYITRYAPGARENGGVYMHAATWALMTACKLKDRAAATSIWNSIAPPLRSQTEPDVYAAEPYVVPGNVDGPLSPTPGRAGWTWYTGSAAWLNKVSLEWVLGIRPTWAGLLIDPCPVEGLGKVRAVRRYRGRDVTVSFDARSALPGTKPVLSVNGRAIQGNILSEEHLNGSKNVAVDVSWTPAEAGVMVTNAAVRHGFSGTE